MANSGAKKLRLKQQREGKRNPELDRLGWYGVNPVEKNTPTFKERLGKMESKHKKRNPSRYGDDSFFCFGRNSLTVQTAFQTGTLTVGADRDLDQRRVPMRAQPVEFVAIARMKSEQRTASHSVSGCRQQQALDEHARFHLLDAIPSIPERRNQVILVSGYMQADRNLE